jgi:copper(I)-binding protein
MYKKKLRLALAAATAAFVLLLGGQLLHAQTPGSGPIAVEQPWARATPAGAKTGAAYGTVINNGSSPDRLVGATTPIAEKVQFHKETEENGISRMRELRSVDLGFQEKIVFKPGDMHIMLVGLKQPLKRGETFPLTLTFEKSGKIDVKESVAGVGARQPEGMATTTPGQEHH